MGWPAKSDYVGENPTRGSKLKKVVQVRTSVVVREVRQVILTLNSQNLIESRVSLR